MIAAIIPLHKCFRTPESHLGIESRDHRGIVSAKTNKPFHRPGIRSLHPKPKSTKFLSTLEYRFCHALQQSCASLFQSSLPDWLPQSLRHPYRIFLGVHLVVSGVLFSSRSFEATIYCEIIMEDMTSTKTRMTPLKSGFSMIFRKALTGEYRTSNTSRTTNFSAFSTTINAYSLAFLIS